ncbi:hypothetical protein EHI8A_228170 [Entamoeba histolytica HM-1:IMSS-B]|uniref:Uncharacterized protein n=6 Tax=Entamoeba histolytica TaxID=5759 RepID=C4M5M2_ENTH1|nr:hypothetical protein EHI_122910 [Entamoeba histolytica HM-1:IMSS]EMD43966.1 Hypothetical protein EHI5A_087780 [Entamoeba histolytica KU27]EMH75495.1 hypothetical protein EHI8A_228170 [Entamoeba histolytica HM-1:IMSS-B]EMS17196.1 hypothetical protein KM1_299320 [Entamoeba histolytica HM-3:IMSS]ENY64313.1 hypothetical protein EHI7A_194310 [Entamoeba histolytica HM-1:IMSS-A]GAT96744.1 hypothetical protein CL6EHI_122910 [Entamoeba histolytica]|eukprot:XP_654249.2 hypothetical protein EHI_122910 [Entamoeba histolytica HM-1:IMSS]
MENTCNCLFCTKFSSEIKTNKNVSLIDLCRCAFLSMYNNQDKKLIEIEELYNFFERHWDIVCHLKEFKNEAWKKMVYITLSTSDYFQNKSNESQETSYWQLKDFTIPEITNKLKTKQSDEPSVSYRIVKRNFKLKEKPSIIPKTPYKKEETRLVLDPYYPENFYIDQDFHTDNFDYIKKIYQNVQSYD